MNIKLTVLLFVLIARAYANPIMENEGTKAEKISESCLIFLNQESLKVSCEIKYKIIDRSTPNIHVHVPVYCTLAQYDEIDKTRKSVDAKIECEGLSYSSLGVFSSDIAAGGIPIFGEREPNSKVEVGCEFLIKTPISDKFTILVTYTQPLINGIAYYLPLFEKNSDPVNMNDFKITFFTTSEFKLNLVTLHPKRVNSMRRLISVSPKHREIIAVAINNDQTVEKAPEK
jgi:hypothetical protein